MTGFEPYLAQNQTQMRHLLNGFAVNTGTLLTTQNLDF